MFYGLAVLLCLILAGTAHIICRRTTTTTVKLAGQKVEESFPAPANNHIIFEEPPAASRPEVFLPDRKPPVATEPWKPKVAIIIDDMGYRHKEGEGFLAMDLNLSFSFLPFAPYTADQAQKALRRQRDILLHLPMEPTDAKWNPGPGALYVSMSKERQRITFTNDLTAVPMAIGINNHMGSKFTANRQAMQILLKLIRTEKLFFVDSVTTHKTVAAGLAEAMGIKTVSRNIFLDDAPKKEKISRQIKAVIALAVKKGWAVAIGHPYPVTLDTLKEFQDVIKNRVTLVGIHELVH